MKWCLPWYDMEGSKIEIYPNEIVISIIHDLKESSLRDGSIGYPFLCDYLLHQIWMKVCMILNGMAGIVSIMLCIIALASATGEKLLRPPCQGPNKTPLYNYWAKEGPKAPTQARWWRRGPKAPDDSGQQAFPQKKVFDESWKTCQRYYTRLRKNRKSAI